MVKFYKFQAFYLSVKFLYLYNMPYCGPFFISSLVFFLPYRYNSDKKEGYLLCRLQSLRFGAAGGAMMKSSC